MMRKNITIFFDGTGQNRSKKSRDEWTNVVLLHDAVASRSSKTVVQSRRYYDGVGTRKEESLQGGAWGVGLDERIEEAYSFLWQEYNNAKEDGLEPHLYIFGFSRGAYAARWLASLIQYGGIPKVERLVRKIFMRHRNCKSLEIDGQDVWHDVVIDYIGVWDTVEASVNPSFNIEEVPECVGSVRHALAMDEWRFKFEPTRYDQSEKVIEMWFPGCHADVGGGYSERGLANAPLWWIANGAIKAGLIVDNELLRNEIAERLGEIKYHDELVDGGWKMGAIWWLTNVCGCAREKYYRTMRFDDQYDQTYNAYAYMAPEGRLEIPQTCVACDTRGEKVSSSVV